MKKSIPAILFLFMIAPSSWSYGFESNLARHPLSCVLSKSQPKTNLSLSLKGTVAFSPKRELKNWGITQKAHAELILTIAVDDKRYTNKIYPDNKRYYDELVEMRGAYNQAKEPNGLEAQWLTVDKIKRKNQAHSLLETVKIDFNNNTQNGRVDVWLQVAGGPRKLVRFTTDCSLGSP